MGTVSIQSVTQGWDNFKESNIIRGWKVSRDDCTLLFRDRSIYLRMFTVSRFCRQEWENREPRNNRSGIISNVTQRFIPLLREKMDRFIVGIVKRVANRVALDRLHRNGDEISPRDSIGGDHERPFSPREKWNVFARSPWCCLFREKSFYGLIVVLTNPPSP